MEEQDLGYADDLWQQIASLGWIGLVFPDQLGGTGGNFIDLAVLLEEMGRSLLPAPFSSTVVLGGLTVLDAGTDAQQRDIIDKLCGGQLRMTLALMEASATLEPWGVETTAVRVGDGYRISGTKLFVPDAQVADLILVAARTGAGSDPAAGITLFLVPGNCPGVGVSQLSSMASDRQCEVTLNGVRVPDDAVLGEVDKGWPVVQRALARAMAGRCLEMLGGADAVLHMTVEYVRQRTQFGRPVGAFQAVQHHCANMAIDVEGSRHIAYQAAWRISEGLPARREVAMAKAWVSGAYQRVCATAHQCHGAIGFTREHDLQLYTRRAKAQELSYGDADSFRELVLRDLDRDELSD
jgi:alkylation response protein AidB-like acyl-CoA dehydrogenase